MYILSITNNIETYSACNLISLFPHDT